MRLRGVVRGLAALGVLVPGAVFFLFLAVVLACTDEWGTWRGVAITAPPVAMMLGLGLGAALLAAATLAGERWARPWSSLALGACSAFVLWKAEGWAYLVTAGALALAAAVWPARLWARDTRRYRLPALLCVVLGLVAWGVSAAQTWYYDWRYAHSPAPALIHWQEVDLRSAAPTARPVFVHFTAAWCEPCRRLERDAYQDPAVVEVLNRDFAPVRRVWARPGGGPDHERFGVDSYPTLVVLDPDRREVGRLSGYRDPAALRAWLGEMLARSAAASESDPPPAEESPDAS